MEILDQISEFLQQGDDEKVYELTKQAIAGDIPARTILDEGLIAGMNIISEQFGRHEIFLPDVLMAARAMQAGMDQLKPLLVQEQITGLGKIVIGTIHGDLHDIGKNLVGLLLEGAGFRVVDLGTDVDGEQFIAAAQENDADIIALSGLLTTSMPEMEKAVATVREANTNRNLNVKVMIGGPPVHHEFAMTIGADAYGMDAPAAVERAREFVTG